MSTKVHAHTNEQTYILLEFCVSLRSLFSTCVKAWLYIINYGLFNFDQEERQGEKKLKDAVWFQREKKNEE